MWYWLFSFNFSVAFFVRVFYPVCMTFQRYHLAQVCLAFVKTTSHRPGLGPALLFAPPLLEFPQVWLGTPRSRLNSPSKGNLACMQVLRYYNLFSYVVNTKHVWSAPLFSCPCFLCSAQNRKLRSRGTVWMQNIRYNEMKNTKNMLKSVAKWLVQARCQYGC